MDKINDGLYDQSGEQIEGLSQVHCGEVLKFTAKVRNQTATATHKGKEHKMLSSFVQIDDEYNPKELMQCGTWLTPKQLRARPLFQSAVTDLSKSANSTKYRSVHTAVIVSG